MVNLKSILELSAYESVGKKGDKKEGARSVTCVEVRRSEQLDRKLCFDQTQGVLVSVEYLTHSHQHPPEISRVEYSDFTPMGAQLFPGQIRALSGRKTVSAVTVLRLVKVANTNSTSFDQPQNAEFWPGCGDDMEKAKLMDSVQPQYPTSARANHVHGRVTFFAVIETDGSLSQITSIHPAPAELEKAGFQAVRQWRYKPATCAGAPFRVETKISVDFWLDI